MRTSAFLLVATLGCISKGTDVPPLNAGSGVTVDPATNTVSVDTAKVPVLPTCAPGQMVSRGAGEWVCSDGAGNADTLDGKHGADFLGAAAQAADSAKLGGLAATRFATSTTADGVADNANALGGRASAAYLALDVDNEYQAAGDLNLRGHHASINFRPQLCIVGRVCGGTISVSGRYCGQTAAVNGAFTWSGSGLTASGYMAGKKLCEGVANCSSTGNLAHICNGEELARSFQIGSGFSNQVWYAPGLTYDCNGWSSGAAGDMGVTWAPFAAKTCDTVLPIACCL